MDYKSVKKGVVKRTHKRKLSIFIDGVSLDRASKRINKKISYKKLVSSLSLGINPTIARYYTILPNQDDSRHRAFLDAIVDAGLDVIFKRLPPIGVDKHITTNEEISSDITAFACGSYDLGKINSYTSDEEKETEQENHENIKHVIILVCPNRDLSYTIRLCNHLGAETVVADFGGSSSNELIKSATKWVDLSDSETIWRD